MARSLWNCAWNTRQSIFASPKRESHRNRFRKIICGLVSLRVFVECFSKTFPTNFTRKLDKEWMEANYLACVEHQAWHCQLKLKAVSLWNFPFHRNLIKYLNYICFDNYRQHVVFVWKFVRVGKISLTSFHPQIRRKFLSRSPGYTRVRALRRS